MQQPSLSPMNPDALRADMAWLFTSPSLLASAVDLPVADAALGRRWLADIKQYDFAEDRALTRVPFRLGHYAEYLMAHALGGLAQHQLLAQQQTVYADRRSLGEFDYLLQTPSGRLCHIELAVKIYLLLPDSLGHIAVGPGLRDALPLKCKTLRRQLGLAATMAGRAALPDPRAAVDALAWIRGWIFYPAQLPTEPTSELAADHLRGWWQCLGAPLPTHDAASVWRILSRQEWLAPRRLAVGEGGSKQALETTLALKFSQHAMPQMVAEYAPAECGGGELARGFVVPPNWPDTDALAALLQRVVQLEASDAA